ncbi:MAG: glycolate oxidase subunit GlcE [gamma proteobacterium symbiont of Bathyaustriella thionipta]|nr:glycolate oxidase subunit GlcE [gamma proteobacterium symbiont of Bathyaustriella thionipta]
MTTEDPASALQEQIRYAAKHRQSLQIVGNHSKQHLGRHSQGEILSSNRLNGIVAYDPSELVISVRAGTAVSVIQETLKKNCQTLPFDPPCFNGRDASIGGAVAAGLAGPSRPWNGAVRDSLLGIRLVDGQARHMRFGGQVMKNVAGYDISRLMAGAWGTLGLLTEVSLKLLPRAPAELTLRHECDATQALQTMRKLALKPYRQSGACWMQGQLRLRFSAHPDSLQQIRQQIGGESEESSFWSDLRDHKLDFFNSREPLWRLSVRPDADIQQQTQIIDWAGAQRWLISTQAADKLRELAEKYSGHAILFANGDRNSAVFQPLDKVSARLQQRLKHTFDPDGIFNPGRMYSDC